MEPRQFLLVGEDQFWPTRLSEAIEPLGHLNTATLLKATQIVQENDYALIILDTTVIDEADAVEFIKRLRKIKPEARVLVVTASPSWTRAREVFRAGAVDYIKRSINIKELRDEVQLSLEKNLSHG